MGFSQISGSVDDAVFEVLGDPAVWTSADATQSVPGVMVLLDGGDQVVVAGQMRVKAAHRVIQVRKSEIRDPGQRSTFTLQSGEVLTVIAPPQLDEEGSVFSCECASPR